MGIGIDYIYNQLVINKKEVHTSCTAPQKLDKKNLTFGVSTVQKLASFISLDIKLFLANTSNVLLKIDEI